jgi:hypothetical protein
MTDPKVIAPVTVAMVGGARPQPAPAASADAKSKIQIPYYENLDD